MKLWVDDMRPPPDDTWQWSRTSTHAIYMLAPGRVTEMSLDHDLGGKDTTRRIVLMMCENPRLWPDEVRVHSNNPPGRKWLEAMIERYKP